MCHNCNLILKRIYCKELTLKVMDDTMLAMYVEDKYQYQQDDGEKL